MNRTLMFWLGVLCLFTGGMLLWLVRSGGRAERVGASQEPGATVEAQVPSGPKLTEFELVDQLGQRIHSREMHGQVWTGSFFFSSCPSTCRQQNMRVQQLQAKYAGEGLKSVSITCDPSNDTPATLARYANNFRADATTWKFLTPADADMNYIQRIGNDYFGVMVGPETHTDRVMVFDREGKMRGAFSVLDPKKFAALDELIAELLKPTDGAANSSTGEAPATTTSEPAAVGNGS